MNAASSDLPTLSTSIASRQPLGEVYEQVELVESLGYDTVWTPEIAGRDALVTSALLAARTSSIGLATGIVPLGVRGAGLTAMGAATVAEAAPGRFRLGVGIGHTETIGPWFGAGRPLRVAEMEAELQRLQALLQGRRAEPEGGRLRGVHHPVPPPIILAALSEKLIRVAARVADGVIFNWVTPARVAELVAVLRAEAARVGRDPGQLRVACYVPVCITEETAAAGRQLARQIAAYGRLAAYRRSLVRSGLGEAAAILARLGPGDADRVPEELIEALGALGPPPRVRARLGDFGAAGVTELILAPVPLPGDLAWASMVETWTGLSPG